MKRESRFRKRDRAGKDRLTLQQKDGLYCAWKQTGQMAAKVLKGEAEASELPYETITEPGFLRKYKGSGKSWNYCTGGAGRNSSRKL